MASDRTIHRPHARRLTARTAWLLAIVACLAIPLTAASSALAVPGPSGSHDATIAQYGPKDHHEHGGGGGGGGGPSDHEIVLHFEQGADLGKTLPFTGFDIGVLLALGVVLLGSGLAVRAVANRP